MATSLQQPLSYVPKVAVVERFNCILYKVSQGCALVVSGHPWCLTFASGQLAKKVLSNSLGLVDFAIGLVIFVLNLPSGQVLYNFWGNSSYRRIIINPAHQKGFCG